MKLLVVYNNDGEIQALVQPPAQGKLQAGVKARSGQHVAELEVPAGLEKDKLSVMHGKLRVDRSSKQPRLVQAG